MPSSRMRMVVLQVPLLLNIFALIFIFSSSSHGFALSEAPATLGLWWLLWLGLLTIDWQFSGRLILARVAKYRYFLSGRLCQTEE